MRNLLRFGVLGAALLAVPACYVHTKETVVEKAPAPTTAATCTNSVWVAGRYSSSGAWIPGYWACTRVTK
jgi:hypothetical protein